MDLMAIKRHTLHLDAADMRLLEREAREESKATGIRVTAAGIVRRLIKSHLQATTKGKKP